MEFSSIGPMKSTCHSSGVLVFYLRHEGRLSILCPAVILFFDLFIMLTNFNEECQFIRHQLIAVRI